jgi:hypothetical protein
LKPIIFNHICLHFSLVLFSSLDSTKTLDKKDEIVYIRLSCKNYLYQGGHYYGNLFGKTRGYKKELACSRREWQDSRQAASAWRQCRGKTAHLPPMWTPAIS